MALIEDMNRKSLHGRLRARDGLPEQAYSARSEWLVVLKMDRIFDPLREGPTLQSVAEEAKFCGVSR